MSIHPPNGKDVLPPSKNRYFKNFYIYVVDLIVIKNPDYFKRKFLIVLMILLVEIFWNQYFPPMNISIFELCDPPHLSFLKPNYSWPVIHQVVSDQEHYTFLYRYAKHNRESRGKEQTNKHGLGSAPSTRGGSLGHFCAALHAFAGYRGQIIARNFPKSTRNADLSFDCPSSIFSLPPFADCVLLWTAISSQLLSSALLCQLTLFVFSPTFLPSSTSGLMGDLALRPFVWVSRQSKEILWPAHTHTNTTNG